MTPRYCLVAATALLACLALAPIAAQQPPLSPGDVDRIKKEATAAVEKYYRLFSEQNMKALPEEVYNVPWISLGPNGPQADLTKEAVQKRFEASLKGLLEQGWGKSVYTTDNVCVLNANAAIVGGRNTRYKKDGSVMSVSGVSYLFAKAPEGWKIITFAGHQAGKVVRCD